MNQSRNECDLYVEQPYVFEELVLMVGVGSFIALFGFLTNIVLIGLFLGLEKYRNSHFAYMGALACLDVLICVDYVALFAVRLVWDYFKIYWLYLDYHSIVIPLFALTRMLRTASVYTIIFATIERFVAVSKIGSQSNNVFKTYRLLFIFLVLLFAVVSRASVYWEFILRWNYACYGRYTYVALDVPAFTQTHAYRTYYKLWFDNIVHTILPFIFLLILNVQITRKLRGSMEMRGGMLQMAFGKKFVAQRKETLRAATYTLVAIVTQYLICNVLGFCLTILEHFDYSFLARYHKFYSFTVNTVNLLHLISSSVRIFVYYWINPQIRVDLKDSFRRVCPCCPTAVKRPRLRLNISTTSFAGVGRNAWFRIFSPATPNTDLNSASKLSLQSPKNQPLNNNFNHSDHRSPFCYFDIEGIYDGEESAV